MSETLLTWIVGGLTALFSTVCAHLYGRMSSNSDRISRLSERVAEIELGGVRGSNALELKVSEQLGSIKEALIRIESRLQHLEESRNEGRNRGLGERS